MDKQTEYMALPNADAADAGVSDDLPLGKQTVYTDRYTPTLLRGIPRADGRRAAGIGTADLPFGGFDDWVGYELSWLGAGGLPQVALLQMRVPAQTPSMPESKSLKLYLNSFNQSQFTGAEQVAQIIGADMQRLLGGKVSVRLLPVEQPWPVQQAPGQGICLGSDAACADP